MALNSHKFNNFSTMLTLGSGSNPTIPSGEAMNRVGQLGLNTKLRKKSLTPKGRAWGNTRINATENVKAKEIPSAQFSCVVHDTESILRMSQILRAQLVQATSSKVSNYNIVADTEEKKKARDMLHARLLRASALAHENKVVGGTSKPKSLDIMTAHLANARSPKRLNLKAQANTHRFILCPSPLTTYYPNNNNNNVGEVIKKVENVSGNDKERKYDGRTHSYPYKKNGPYTCPKCMHVCETSQKFAAHVSSSHYKYESKSERKKRVMAKVRERTKNLRLHRVKEGLTIVPRDFVASDDNAGNNNIINNNIMNNNNNVNGAPGSPVMIKIESVEVGEGVRGVKYALAPPPGMELIPGAGVKIKLEPIASMF